MDNKKKPKKNTTKNATPEKTLQDTPLKKDHNCTFCGRAASKIRLMIAGPPPNNPFICEDCVEVCVAILLDECKIDWVMRFNNLLVKAPAATKIISMEKTAKHKKGAKKK